MPVHVNGLLVDHLVLMKQSIFGPDQTCFQGAFAHILLSKIAWASAREWNRQTQQLWQEAQTLWYPKDGWMNIN